MFVKGPLNKICTIKFYQIQIYHICSCICKHKHIFVPSPGLACVLDLFKLWHFRFCFARVNKDFTFRFTFTNHVFHHWHWHQKMTRFPGGKVTHICSLCHQQSINSCSSFTTISYNHIPYSPPDESSIFVTIFNNFETWTWFFACSRWLSKISAPCDNHATPMPASGGFSVGCVLLWESTPSIEVSYCACMC